MPFVKEVTNSHKRWEQIFRSSRCRRTHITQIRTWPNGNKFQTHFASRVVIFGTANTFSVELVSTLHEINYCIAQEFINSITFIVSLFIRFFAQILWWMWVSVSTRPLTLARLVNCYIFRCNHWLWTNFYSCYEQDYAETFAVCFPLKFSLFFQVEGGFVQGMGMFTLEEVRYSQTGSLWTQGPGAYKIPGFSDIPVEFYVHLLRSAPNEKAVFSSKVWRVSVPRRD